MNCLSLRHSFGIEVGEEVLDDIADGGECDPIVYVRMGILVEDQISVSAVGVGGIVVVRRSHVKSFF